MIKENTEKPTQGSSYFKGEKGNKNCEDQGGSNIIKEDECKVACNELEIGIDKLKNNAVCYVAGNNKCRQTGRAGSKASMICKKTGTNSIYVNMYNTIYVNCA